MADCRLKKENRTFEVFMSYLNCFEKAKLDGRPNEEYHLMENLIRPRFANLHKSIVPQIGQFKDKPLNAEIICTLRDNWSPAFSAKPECYIKLPMFDRVGYQAYKKLVLPTVQVDLRNKTRNQKLKMYNACANQVSLEYKMMCTNPMLEASFSWMAEKSVHMGSEQMSSVLARSTSFYLQQDASIRDQMMKEGDSHEKIMA